MKWFALITFTGFALLGFGWFYDLPSLVRVGVWLEAPLGLAIVIGIFAALFGRGTESATTTKGGMTKGPPHGSPPPRRPRERDLACHERNYIDVPYAENDRAKAAGALFDGGRRSWYYPGNISMIAFRRWIPGSGFYWRDEVQAQPSAPAITGGQRLELDNGEDGVTVLAPLFVGEATQPCWKCGRATKVHALVVSGAELEDDDGGTITELLTVSRLGALPRTIAAALAQSWPAYHLDLSKQTQQRYFMNHCYFCGIKIGDFHVHEEPGGGFMPMSPAEARSIDLHRLPFDGRVSIQGSIGIPDENLIQRYARRL